MLCGKVGCGKSTYAKKLKQEKKAVILSCDDLMLTLFDECIGPKNHQMMLSRCKSFLYVQAEEYLIRGIDVVLDFGFWTKQERDEVRNIFDKKGIQVKLYYFETPYETITKHIKARNKKIIQGVEHAYSIDDDKRVRFDGQFEEPDNTEAYEVICPEE